MPVLIHCWKDLLIDFVASLSLSDDRKSNSYDSILVIVDRLTKMIYYKLVKVIINTPRLAKVIINVVMRYYGFPDSIINYRRAIFIFKFWSLLCYFPVSRDNFLPYSIFRLIVRLKGKIVLWKCIFVHLSISSTTIGPNFYLWPYLLSTIPKMLASFTSWTTITIFVCLTKKILILFPNLNWLMNYQMSFINSYWFIVKDSIMPKSFKNKPTIKAQSLKAILWVIKFGWTTNISKLNNIESWKINFLVFSKFCI